MIVAGAGGHGLEVRQVLIEQGIPASEILFFDEDPIKVHRKEIHGTGIFQLAELQKQFIHDPRFVLGVGNPIFREKLFQLLTSLGGRLFGISNVFNSESKISSHPFDAMQYSFIGPETNIGLGVLVNTRAHVHHECAVGDFSEIGPGAILLGGSKIGRACRIGAGAVILPGVQLGDEVVVGAGAVVTRDCVKKGKVLKGIPAK
jgi:sugar O-acyltransferase (sialic acid O-acetyltransferase NeuD family)